jgi:outer membrane lipoprotein-sorting protein
VPRFIGIAKGRRKVVKTTAFLTAMVLLFVSAAAADVPADETAGAATQPEAVSETPAAPGESAADVAPVDAELDAFLEKLDRRQAEIERLSADITITNVERFSGGRSARPRSGRIYVRKPDSIFIDFTEPRLRKIWICDKEIVDYKPALSTAERVLLGEGADGPEIIGVSTTFADLRERFDFALTEPSDDDARYTLTLTPRPGLAADFTEAEIRIDAESLLPVEIVQKDDKAGIDKTFTLSRLKVNPRLSDGLFEVKLKSSVDVEEYRLGDWKGI